VSGGFLDAAVSGLPLDEADYVIVGSGAGGGAAARALAASGRSVAVLEDGPLPDASGVPALKETMARLYRGSGRTSTLGQAPIPLLQARCVGGTTFVNSAIIWRLPEKVLASWHEQHGLRDGLPARELDLAYEQLEREMHVREVEPAAVGRQDQLMALGARKTGIEARTIHRSEQGCRGSARCFHGCPSGAKQSTAQNYLRRAVQDGAQVVAHAPVQRVLVQGGRAVGVRGTVAGEGGRAFEVRARKAVIVCASAIGSSNLLFRSGLARPGLGDRFMAHPGTTVMALYPDAVDMWTGAAQGYEAFGLRDSLGVKLETINVPPEVVASRLPGAGGRFARWLEQLPRIAAFAIALRAEAQGTVRPSRLLGELVRYSLTDSDVARLVKGVRVAAEMHLHAGASEVLLGVHGLPETIRSADELRALDQARIDARSFTMLATHLFGGCCAGRDERASVVDPSLRVHGLQGLYVMDASVFPSNTGVNPQHAIMAIATVAARRLAGA
jgi:choline dehydrogenase-like flavoprotein